MDRSSIHRVSVADQVAGVLRQRILVGELRPGTALEEIPLASSLGVSRNTMREAMRILCLEGLLRRSAHRGIAVTQLSRKDVKEIYHVRRVLETSAVLGARDARKEVLRELQTALEHYEESVRARNWVNAVTHDLHFHALLIQFLENRRLESFYQKTIAELRMGMPGYSGRQHFRSRSRVRATTKRLTFWSWHSRRKGFRTTVSTTT